MDEPQEQNEGLTEDDLKVDPRAMIRQLEQELSQAQMQVRVMTMKLREFKQRAVQSEAMVEVLREKLEDTPADKEK